MRIIGKLNRKLYKFINDDIKTEEVILTDERIEHIIKRRGPNFYQKYSEYFIEILQDPDYIFLDKTNTLLVCKQFKEEKKFINIVLRIIISTDNPNYKNSILTVIGENYRRFQQRLRNNPPIYKKE